MLSINEVSKLIPVIFHGVSSAIFWIFVKINLLSKGNISIRAIFYVQLYRKKISHISFKFLKKLSICSKNLTVIFSYLAYSVIKQGLLLQRQSDPNSKLKKEMKKASEKRLA